MKLLITVCVLFILPWNVMATSQCPPGAECGASPEMKLSILAYLNSLLEPCSEIKPEKANEYRTKYNQLQKKFYKDMKTHPMYDDVIIAYKKVVDNMSERSIKRECKSILRVMNDELKALEDEPSKT